MSCNVMVEAFLEIVGDERVMVGIQGRIGLLRGEIGGGGGGGGGVAT